MISECVFCHRTIQRDDPADAWHAPAAGSWAYDCQHGKRHGGVHRPLPAHWMTVHALLQQAWDLTPANERDEWGCFEYGTTPKDWVHVGNGRWHHHHDTPSLFREMYEAELRYYAVEQIANMGVNIDPDTPVENFGNGKFNGTERE